MEFSQIDYHHYLNIFLESIVTYAPSLISAILTLFIGLMAIKWIRKVVHMAFKKTKLDPAVESFLESLMSIGLKVLLIIMVASMLGVQTTSLVAIMGAAGLAVGLALQGSLANFAGGVLILIFKPFKIGHYIEAQGHAGTVEAIQIFNTVLKTPDNKRIILPNGNLSNNSLTNFNVNKTRRIDFVFGIGYGDDIKKAKKVLEKLVKADKRILKDPEHLIGVGNLGDSSVDLFCRVWVKTSDYWSVFFDMNEAVKLTFDQEKISIPFPQRDVHLIK